MIIPIIMHIHLVVILGMVIFPLAVLKFLLGLFWPKIKGEKPILAILGENCLRVTASGKLVTFFHPLEVFESFSF